MTIARLRRCNPSTVSDRNDNPALQNPANAAFSTPIHVGPGGTQRRKLNRRNQIVDTCAHVECDAQIVAKGGSAKAAFASFQQAALSGSPAATYWRAEYVAACVREGVTP